MDKVYQQLLEIIREEGKYYNDEQLKLGEVKSVNPLKVAYGDMFFSGEDLKVSEDLLEKTVPVEFFGANNQVVDLDIACGDTVRRCLLDSIKEIKIPSVLKNGDSVVVILRGNVLWVLCKVV